MSKHVRLFTPSGDDIGNINQAMARRMKRLGLTAQSEDRTTLVTPRAFSQLPVKRQETTWHHIATTDEKNETHHCVLHLYLESAAAYPGAGPTAKPIPVGEGSNLPGIVRGGPSESVIVQLPIRQKRPLRSRTFLPLLTYVGTGEERSIEHVGVADFLHKHVTPGVRASLGEYTNSVAELVPAITHPGEGAREAVEYDEGVELAPFDADNPDLHIPDDWGWLFIVGSTKTHEVFLIPWVALHQDGIVSLAPVAPDPDTWQVIVDELWWEDGIDDHGRYTGPPRTEEEKAQRARDYQISYCHQSRPVPLERATLRSRLAALEDRKPD